MELSSQGRSIDRLSQHRTLFDRPDHDLPGYLSFRRVPRHDNDHEDFRQVKILPTVDEILSISQATYVPTKTGVHFLPPGPQRMLDTHFRQLRYDQTEKIRAICYEAFQRAFRGSEHTDADHYADYQSTYNTSGHLAKTLEGHQYLQYQNVEVIDLLSHDSKALLVSVSYDCPPEMRGKALYKSGRLEKGMLVALLGHDTSNGDLFVWYFETHMAQSTMALERRGGGGLKAAVQLSFIDNDRVSTVTQCIRLAYKLCPSIKLCLVEFPKALCAGLTTCLGRLQQLQPNLDIAFLKYIAADLTTDLNFTRNITMPAYSAEPGFEFQLRGMDKEPPVPFIDTSYVRPEPKIPQKVSPEDLRRPEIVDTLQQLSTLDRGQAAALRDALSREFALIQGPPGTGKTFLGVTLTKVLLASRPQKPILLVCLTNHALDSFMTHLKAAGTGKLVRIGSGSKEEWTKAINISQLARKQRYTINEHDAMNSIRAKKRQLFVNIELETKGLQQQNLTSHISWTTIMATLEATDKKSFDQLAFHNDKFAQAFTFEYWSAGGDLKNISKMGEELASRLAASKAMHDEEASTTTVLPQMDTMLQDLSQGADHLDQLGVADSIWNLPLSKRKTLITEWAQMVDHEVLVNRLILLYKEHQEASQQLIKFRQALHRRILQSQDVIGITTTACAAMWEQLLSLDLEIMICEEAGEVLEAHTLTTLLPTLKHAIFIGDPEQLRPQLDEQIMSTDKSGDYRLDESLFGRLSDTTASSQIRLPTSRLAVQRRMFPDIANLARLTYPFLEDHVSTFTHPSPGVLRPRMFWLDHRCPETEIEKSFRNDHEVEWAIALVRYLLRSGKYTPRDIAVLATYNGQLKALCDSLRSECGVFLDAKDRDNLRDFAPGEHVPGDDSSEEVDEENEFALAELLRVATIDNFQGEEAKIVILTTVRSGSRAGFMSSPNRINVACSRARDAFYIIGDSATLQQVPMWNRVINVFANIQAIGDKISACCERHPKQHKRIIQKPLDLNTFDVCPMKCGVRLGCGHICQRTCHPTDEHRKLLCLEPCMKPLPCSHPCTNGCAEPCGPCNVSIGKIRLPCGHISDTYCSSGTPSCQEVDRKEELPCGHEADIICGQSTKDVVCMSQCGTPLTCGHHCTVTCSVCKTRHPEIMHRVCSFPCNNMLSCGHECASFCHHDRPCPPCKVKVADPCQHGNNERACLQTVYLCTKTNLATCSHKMPTGLCCLPQLRKPCSEPCQKVLECGHLCPSLCAETCPPKEHCKQCITGNLPGRALLYMPDCGHLVNVEEADALNSFVNGSNKSTRLRDATCICLKPCPTVRRYALLAHLQEFPVTFDRMLGQIGQRVYRFASALQQAEKDMPSSLKSTIQSIRPGPLAAKSNFKMLMARDQKMNDLKQKIVSYRRNVVDPFQTCVVELAKYPLDVGANVMFHARLDVLEYRATGLQLSDLLEVAKHLIPMDDPSFEVQRQAKQILKFVSEHCKTFIPYAAEAEDRNKEQGTPALQCELCLYQVQFKLLDMLSRRLLTKLGGSTDLPALEPDSRGILLQALDYVLETAKHYPALAGGFVDVAKRYKELSDVYKVAEINAKMAALDDTDEDIPDIAKVGSAGMIEVERLWSRHVPGTLTVCDKGHPYSKTTFENGFGCPECGKYVESLEEQFRQNGDKLQEDDFLARMKAL